MNTKTVMKMSKMKTEVKMRKMKLAMKTMARADLENNKGSDDEKDNAD